MEEMGTLTAARSYLMTGFCVKHMLMALKHGNCGCGPTSHQSQTLHLLNQSSAHHQAYLVVQDVQADAHDARHLQVAHGGGHGDLQDAQGGAVERTTEHTTAPASMTMFVFPATLNPRSRVTWPCEHGAAQS
jgi:hypothetical protein